MQVEGVHFPFAADRNYDPSLLGSPLPSETGWRNEIAGWVMRSRQPLLIQDLTRDTRFNTQASSARAYLGAPMTIGERVIGVIAVAHPQANTFDANDLRLLTTLAGQIAAAIERAR